MRRVVPSQVLGFLNSAFPSREHDIGNAWSSKVAVLVNLLEHLPDELIALEEQDYSLYLTATQECKKAVELWNTGTSSGDRLRLSVVPGFPEIQHEHVVSVLGRLLEKCPDEAPSAATHDLPFIDDAEFRQSLRADLTATERALANGEWKAATVLAGSILEALLLWALQGRSDAEVERTRQEVNAETDSRPLEKDPQRWSLEGYIKVSVALGIVSEETASQTHLAKGFRNLIHPGRAHRLQTECNRATALSAVAAVEHVAADLQRAG